MRHVVDLQQIIAAKLNVSHSDAVLEEIDWELRSSTRIGFCGGLGRENKKIINVKILLEAVHPWHLDGKFQWYLRVEQLRLDCYKLVSTKS